MRVYKKIQVIFMVFLFALTIKGYASSSFHLVSIFSSEKQQNALASFVDNVLRQLPSGIVIGCIKEIMDEGGEKKLSDIEVYQRLQQKLLKHRSVFDKIRVIKLVNFQKAMLKNDIEKLLKKKATFKNCLEIGTPGTYLSTIAHRITGKVYALLEKASITDVIQAPSFNIFNGFKGYDSCVALGDYDPISQSISDNSVDLVMCTIGLHHCPVEKLDNFIESIKRVLRPGGIFILREHNAHSETLRFLAYAAHSIFNVIIPQETKEVELHEVRNFQSLAYWKELLGSHGFTAGKKEYLQEGDSTLNTLVAFIKECRDLQDHIACVSEEAQQVAGYTRDKVQTYLTTPEWNNVDASQQYSEFINKVPFYEFPYMAHVGTFWKTFFASWRCAAKAKGGNLKLLFSPNIFVNYTLMNLFIGTFMTVEYSTKALVSAPIRAMFSGVEAAQLLVLIHDPRDEILSIDPGITVKKRYAAGLKLVSIPRYLQFLHTIKKLTLSTISIIKIAGNDEIVCKIRYKKNNSCEFKSSWVEKFTWQMPTQPDYVYAAYLVPVSELKDFIVTVENHNNELLYVHDF